MQLFNEINCRRIYNELNMFRGVLTNPIFVAIWLLSAAVQVPEPQARNIRKKIIFLYFLRFQSRNIRKK